MTENLNSGVGGEACQSSEAGVERGAAALGMGVSAAKEGFDHAQEYLDDGLDYARKASRTLADFVTRQPLLAIGGAFLIGYLAARMLRRVSSS
jgi:hypothetical protein